MILFLQKNYNGTFAVAEKNNYKDEVMDFDYYTLIDDIPADTCYVDLVNYLAEQYHCKKLVLDF